jgi:hypothetical protein
MLMFGSPNLVNEKPNIVERKQKEHAFGGKFCRSLPVEGRVRSCGIFQLLSTASNSRPKHSRSISFINVQPTFINYRAIAISIKLPRDGQPCESTKL